MLIRHLLLAVLVTAIWGTNFVVMHYGLAESPPLLFAALRFTFAVFPALFFIRRPPVAWKMLAAYGLLIGVGQFGLLFIAMRADITPGLASLVIQLQVFFTVLLAAVLCRERVQLAQISGLVCAAVGLAIIATFANRAATPVGILLVLLAALSWAGANIVMKVVGRLDMLGFVTWSSLFAAPALIGLALLIEGPIACIHALGASGVQLWGAVAWQAYANTLFGYAIWGWLLSRYPAAIVTPTGLLIPLFGMGASSVVLGEPLTSWKIISAILVVAGLIIGAFGSRWRNAAMRMKIISN